MEPRNSFPGKKKKKKGEKIGIAFMYCINKTGNISREWNEHFSGSRINLRKHSILARFFFLEEKNNVIESLSTKGAD